MDKPEPTRRTSLPQPSSPRRLTQAQFQGLQAVPPEVEWFANIDNPRTRAAYQNDLQEFTRFVGTHQPEEFRAVTRSHVLAWRKDLEAAGHGADPEAPLFQPVKNNRSGTLLPEGPRPWARPRED